MISSFGLFIVFLFVFNCFYDVKSNQLYLQPDSVDHGYFTNQNFVITCVTTDDSSKDLIWLGNDENEIKEKHGRIHVEPFHGNVQGLRLVVEKVQKEDEGQYVCTDLKESESFSLSVYKSISFSDTPLVEQAPEGESASIECHAKADPAPVVDWFFNGVKLVSSDRVEVENNVVTIHNVNRSDAGIYKCKALVTTKLASQMESIDIKFHVEYMPEFVDGSESVVYASVGLLANLSCMVSAVPPPKFQWMRNGDFIHNGSDFTIMNNETRSVLQFVVNDKSQFGEYMCEVGNSVGTESKIIRLEEGDTPKAPRFEDIVEGKGTLTLKLQAQDQEEEVEGGLEVTGFKVQYILATETWDQANSLEFSIGDQYVLKNISYNTEYLLRAAAGNAAGYGEYSEEKSYKTQPLQVSPVVADKANILVTSLFLMVFGACVLWAFN